MCHMTHSCVQHDSFIRVTWRIHMYAMTLSYVWRDSFIYMTWFFHTCDIIPSYVWNMTLSSEFVTHISMWHVEFVTHSYVYFVCDCLYMWHNSFICVKHDAFIWVCDSYIYAACRVRDSFICGVRDTFMYVTAYICARHDALIWVRDSLYVCGM